MSTFREILYMIQDECKFDTDDSYYTHEHIMYLVGRYRSLLFKQTYGGVNGNLKKQIPASAFQEICIDLVQTPGNMVTMCDSGMYLRSTKPIPSIMPYTKANLYNTNIYSTISHIDLTNYERMKYVGHNKFLQKIIYASIAPDNYLWLKSQNSVFLNLEKLKMRAVFEDFESAAKMACDADCEMLDRQFPLEDALIPVLIQSVVKELTEKLGVPEDKSNNADDNQNENMYSNGNARPTEE